MTTVCVCDFCGAKSINQLKYKIINNEGDPVNDIFMDMCESCMQRTKKYFQSLV